MKKMTITWMLMLMLLLTLLLFIGVNIKNKNKNYVALENDLKEISQVYFGQDANSKKLPQNKKYIKITLDELKKLGLEINNKIGNEECDGYVKITGLTNSFKYEAFIKCDNYETNGYEE